MKPDPSDPSFVSALIYFTKAAEKQSFAAAAKALNVTPSAVSHRIKSLEEALNQRLFWRDVRSVHLTAEGAELARVTGAALSSIRMAAEKISHKRVLHVYVGPYLAAMWLMERLKDFELSHPGLEINLVHDERMVVGDVDVAVTWGGSDTFPDDATPLFDNTITPVLAPSHKLKGAIWDSHLDPVHYQDRSTWRHWLQTVGAPEEYAERGQVYSDPSLVFQAAAHGRGIALGFLPFVAKMLQKGELVSLSPQTCRALRVYKIKLNTPHCREAEPFLEWIIALANQETFEAAGSKARSYNGSP